MFGPYSGDPALLRDIETDFGYLPYPKYDETQKEYVVWSNGGMLAIPATASDIERTGAIVEALSAGSNKYIKEAFIEKYIENKVLRDEESVQIYRMMRDLATYDVSFNIDPSATISQYRYYKYFLDNNTANVASYYESVKTMVEENYAKLFATAMEG